MNLQAIEDRKRFLSYDLSLAATEIYLESLKRFEIEYRECLTDPQSRFTSIQLLADDETLFDLQVYVLEWLNARNISYKTFKLSLEGGESQNLSRSNSPAKTNLEPYPS